ncbi:hypothetical protein SAMN05216235_0264 [Salinicoccus halodurans]|uniref:Uncharacterized protein n=1 Tax=Salinicoccus halodurans TaxID=407035 RepID=A0AA94KUC1_9STAP|nr:hypothetical protein SAMN05216235_0264 [Salinicoccus halodurans]
MLRRLRKKLKQKLRRILGRKGLLNNEYMKGDK